MGLLDGSPSSASDASELFEAEEVLAPEVSAKGLRAGVPPAPASPEAAKVSAKGLRAGVPPAPASPEAAKVSAKGLRAGVPPAPASPEAAKVSAKGLRAGVPPAPASPEAAEAPLDVAPGAKDAPGEASDDSTESADERPAEPSPGPLGPEEVEERADLLLQQFGLAPPARPEPLPSAEPSEPPLRPEPPQEETFPSPPPTRATRRIPIRRRATLNAAACTSWGQLMRRALTPAIEAAPRVAAAAAARYGRAWRRRRGGWRPSRCWSRHRPRRSGRSARSCRSSWRGSWRSWRPRRPEMRLSGSAGDELKSSHKSRRTPLREASLASEPSDSSRPPPLSPEGQEEAFSWLQDDQLVCLKSMQPAALQRLADDVHKKLMRRAGAEGVYRAMELFSETFKLASESTRRTVFFALNELCRPLRKEPVSRYSKLVRHACWTFLKNITAVDMSAKERQFLTRFLRQHSSTRDEPSFIWRAAGDHSAETKDWQQRLARWEAAVMGRQSLLEVQDQMSTYQLQQMTGDGLVLAMVRTRDQTLETNQREELAQEVLQLVLVFLLHIASLFLQFGLTYHLYITTVDGLAAPFDEGVGAYMQVIQQAVEQDPPHALSKDNDVQKDALDLCVKQHAMGYVHLMVLSLWAARMVAEISELLNRLTILSLIADPTNEPLARAFLQEREDGRMLIAYMGRRMKVAVITLCILPKLGCTIFLMWTGGKLFMLTYTMGSLIIPLLTLTYILQIPSILFTGFSSFKFKDQCPAGSRSKASEILRRLFATF
ncbi:unnamed protein product [Effrenium voratum]|uniref:Uncharacterized protein n=1 Tax=Effrenium voratum TaxID=2562239 RepID=A0AA36JKF2_9DINO|nr:unnamed protein product [Effrenium voratum]